MSGPTAPVTLADVRAARERIAAGILRAADREHVAALVARLEADGFVVTPATRPPFAG